MKLIPYTTTFFSITSAFLLTACSTTEEQITPKVAAQYDAPTNLQSGNASLDWWTYFDDPVLEKLLESVTEENLTLKEACAKISEARHLSHAESANKLPSVSASASSTRKMMSKNGTNGDLIRSGSTDRTISYFSGGLDASWELDFFGENRLAREAAYSQFEAANYSYGSLVNSLLSEAAVNYFSFRIAEVQLKTARNELIFYREEYELVSAQVEAGVSSESMLYQIDNAVESALSTVSVYELNQQSALHALAILTGDSVSHLRSIFEQKQDFVLNIDDIPLLGLPLDLLRNRPDVLESETLLRVEVANLGIRKAALYPHISLVGNIGQESIGIDTFADGSSSIFSFGPTLSLPLFNGGELRSLKKAQAERVKQFQYALEDTILRAIRDVENSSARIDQRKAQMMIALKSEDNSSKQLRISEKQYELGIVTKLELLQQRLNYEAYKKEQITAKYNLAVEIVGLGKALGGGWQSFGQVERAPSERDQ